MMWKQAVLLMFYRVMLPPSAVLTSAS